MIEAILVDSPPQGMPHLTFVLVLYGKNNNSSHLVVPFGHITAGSHENEEQSARSDFRTRNVQLSS